MAAVGFVYGLLFTDITGSVLNLNMLHFSYEIFVQHDDQNISH